MRHHLLFIIPASEMMPVGISQASHLNTSRDTLREFISLTLQQYRYVTVYQKGLGEILKSLTRNQSINRPWNGFLRILKSKSF